MDTNMSVADVPTVSPSLEPNNVTVLVPFVKADVILFSVFIFIFLVFGFTANFFTIVVIASSNKLRSIFHFFIFSLCVSDCTSALISWINLYRRTWGFDDFELSDFVCKLYWAVDIWTSYSTALHILSFAILRLITLLRFQELTSGRRWLIWVVLIWIVTFFAGAVPFYLISGARPIDRNSNSPVSKWPSCTLLLEKIYFYRTYTYIAYPIFFYIPIVFTVGVSISIVVLMLRRNRSMKNHVSDASAKKRRRKEKHAVLQLTLIVTSFMIGYVPFTAFEFFTINKSNTTYEAWWIDWHFGTAQYMFLRLSECLNPVFYNLGSKRLRDEAKKFILDKCCCSFGLKPPTKRFTTYSMSTTRDF